MTEIVNSWPWYDRAIFGAVMVGLLYVSYVISKQLAHISGQNERIINLLAQIRDQGDR